jgi:hypothetical protein
VKTWKRVFDSCFFRMDYPLSELAEEGPRCIHVLRDSHVDTFNLCRYIVKRVSEILHRRIDRRKIGTVQILACESRDDVVLDILIFTDEGGISCKTVTTYL